MYTRYKSPTDVQTSLQFTHQSLRNTYSGKDFILPSKHLSPFISSQQSNQYLHEESHLKQLKSILDSGRNQWDSREEMRVDRVKQVGSVMASKKTTLEKLHNFKNVVDRLVSENNFQSQVGVHNQSEGKYQQALHQSTRPQLNFKSKQQKHSNSSSNKFSDFQSIQTQITQQIMTLRQDKIQLQRKLQQQINKNYELYKLLKKDDNQNQSIIHRLKKKDDLTLQQQNVRMKSKIKTLQLQIMTLQQQPNYQMNKKLQNVINHLERELLKKDDEIKQLKKKIENNGIRLTNSIRSKHQINQLQTIPQNPRPNPIIRQNNKLQIQILRLKSQNQRLSCDSHLLYQIQQQVSRLTVQNNHLKKQLQHTKYRPTISFQTDHSDQYHSFSKNLSTSTQNLIGYDRKQKVKIDPAIEALKTIKNINKY